jgi:hypothetical protein
VHVCHELSTLCWWAVQEQFVQLWQQDPSSGVYNVPWAVRLRGKLDAAALEAALQLVAKRHLVSCSTRDCILLEHQRQCTVLMHDWISEGSGLSAGTANKICCR